MQLFHLFLVFFCNFIWIKKTKRVTLQCQTTKMLSDETKQLQITIKNLFGD